MQIRSFLELIHKDNIWICINNFTFEMQFYIKTQIKLTYLINRYSRIQDMPQCLYFYKTLTIH